MISKRGDNSDYNLHSFAQAGNDRGFNLHSFSHLLPLLGIQLAARRASRASQAQVEKHEVGSLKLRF